MIDNPLNHLSARRGSALTQSKLDESDIATIRQCVAERERLRAEANQLSNASLAKKYNVHQRTIEKAIAGYTWSHVA